MHEARDAEDARLLAAGDHARLLATYLPIVQGRVYVRVRDSGADDVVQDVMLRLISELRAGNTYAVPYRVVVHNVTTWTIKAHYARRAGDVVDVLPPDWTEADPGEVAVEDGAYLEGLFAELPPREREVGELRYLHGLEINEIAARLGVRRNAVDQALHRAHRRLRELLDG